MVAHQTECKHVMPESLPRFLDDLVETEAVPVVAEDFLPGVTAEDDVIYRSRRMNARFAWHVEILSPIFKSSRPDPVASPW